VYVKRDEERYGDNEGYILLEEITILLQRLNKIRVGSTENGTFVSNFLSNFHARGVSLVVFSFPVAYKL
jgi:hypothetical protein